MGTSDKEQRSVDVPQHKRLAQGAPIDGTSYGVRESAPVPKRREPSRTGGLSSLPPKKK